MTLIRSNISYGNSATLVPVSNGSSPMMLLGALLYLLLIYKGFSDVLIE